MATKSRTGICAIVLTGISFFLILFAFCTPWWLETDGSLPQPKFVRIVFFEPTDVPIAMKPFKAKNWTAIKYITPNLNELKEIAKGFNCETVTNVSGLQEAAFYAKSVAEKVPNVIVTMGDQGVIIAKQKITEKKISIEARHYPVEIVKEIVNVSGAGDCFAAGFITGMLEGYNEEICVAVGFAGAGHSLKSKSAVPESFFDKRHKSWMKPADYIVI